MRCCGNLAASARSVQRDCSLLALGGSDGLLDGALLGNTHLLLGELADGEGSSLSVDHDAEAVHVAKAGAFGGLLHLLGGGSLLELLGELELLPCLGDSGGSGTAEEGQTQLGEGESTQGVEAAGEVNAVDEDLLVIAPVNDGHEFAVILSEVNVSSSAGFDEISKDLKLSQYKFTQI